VAIFAVRRMDVQFEQRVNIKFKHNITVLPHPPYSPDLSPCDFLFPRLKKRLKGRRHENIKAIQAAATMELTGIHQLLSGLAETLATVY
jgi:transposase